MEPDLYSGDEDLVCANDHNNSSSSEQSTDDEKESAHEDLCCSPRSTAGDGTPEHPTSAAGEYTRKNPEESLGSSDTSENSCSEPEDEQQNTKEPSVSTDVKNSDKSPESQKPEQKGQENRKPTSGEYHSLREHRSQSQYRSKSRSDSRSFTGYERWRRSLSCSQQRESYRRGHRYNEGYHRPERGEVHHRKNYRNYRSSPYGKVKSSTDLSPYTKAWENYVTGLVYQQSPTDKSEGTPGLTNYSYPNAAASTPTSSNGAYKHQQYQTYDHQFSKQQTGSEVSNIAGLTVISYVYPHRWFTIGVTDNLRTCSKPMNIGDSFTCERLAGLHISFPPNPGYDPYSKEHKPSKRHYAIIVPSESHISHVIRELKQTLRCEPLPVNRSVPVCAKSINRRAQFYYVLMTTDFPDLWISYDQLDDFTCGDAGAVSLPTTDFVCENKDASLILICTEHPYHFFTRFHSKLKRWLIPRDRERLFLSRFNEPFQVCRMKSPQGLELSGGFYTVNGSRAYPEFANFPPRNSHSFYRHYFSQNKTFHQ